MNEGLVGQVRTQRLGTTRLREGDAVAEVDVFLDLLCAALEQGDDVRALADAARFTRGKARALDI